MYLRDIKWMITGEMMNKNIIKKLTITLFAGSLLFTSCGEKIDENTSTSSEQTTVAEVTTEVKQLFPAFGGTLNLAMNKPASLNVLDNKVRDVADVLSLVYEPLFVLDEHENPVGVLAKSYEYDESGRGVIVHLREGVLFHDEIPFTASDVKFTVDYIKTHPESPYNFYALPIKLVSIIDDYTVKFYYDEPYAYAPSDMIFPIVSGDYISSASYDANIPVGTGPYKYKEFQTTSHLDLTYFDKYREDCYIENIHATIVNESSEIENMFKAGLIDVYAPKVFNWNDYSGDTEKRVAEYVSRNLSFIGFNFEKKDILTKEIRTAIMKGIDRKSMAYKLFVDKVELSNTPVLYGAYFNPDDALDLSFDENIEPVASEESPLKFKMLVNSSSSNNVKIAETLASDLAKLNIELENVLLGKDEYFAKLKAGDFDMYLANVRLSSRPDYYSLLSTEGSQNFGKYSSPLMDDYIKNLISSTSEDAIKSNVQSIETQFLSDLPYATLFFHDGGVMLSTNAKGDYVVYKDNLYYGIRELYINEE